VFLWEKVLYHRTEVVSQENPEMPLKIVKATEPMPVDNIVITVYAQPGLGKSTLGFTADKPLLLDFDKGCYRAAKRGDAVPIASWQDVQEMTAEELAPFNTIIVDTAGRALDSLSQDIIASNPKAGRSDGSLTLQGFGTLKSRFSQWQAFLRSLGKDLVLICHMDEQKNGDETFERIDAQGGSKNEIYKSSDAMCRIRLDSKGGRFLDFDPQQGGFGKNPAQLPKITFPHPDQDPKTLAKVINQIKNSINKLTEQQAAAEESAQAWDEALKEAADIDQFNVLTKVAKESKERKEKGAAAKINALAAEAKKRGYKANKTTGLFEEVKVA
jgi:hypothetical protein